MTSTSRRARGIRRRAALALLLACAFVAVAYPRPPGALAASAASAALAHAVRAQAAVSISSDVITSTDGGGATQVLTAPSGVTTARLPTQVRSRKALPVVVRTTPRALVTLTITFADGTAIQRARRADLDGVARFAPFIAYQPQGGPEAATVAVTAVLPRTGLNDTLGPASVTVLPHIVLMGRIRAPSALVVGGTLALTVVSNLPNVAVQVTLTYPDRQVEQQGGYTDATGALQLSIAVSPLHGVGVLRIGALLSYGGVEQRLTPVVVRLRAPRARR